MSLLATLPDHPLSTLSLFNPHPCFSARFELSAYIHTLNSNDGHWKGAGSGNADQFALELAAFYLDGFSDVHDAFDEFRLVG